MSSIRRARLGLSLLAPVCALALQCAHAQPRWENYVESEERLFNLGWSAYDAKAWSNASTYLYAYMHLRPAVLRNDPIFSEQLIKAFVYSTEQASFLTGQGQKLPDCERELASARGRAVSIGRTLPPPAIDWKRMKDAAGYQSIFNR